MGETVILNTEPVVKAKKQSKFAAAFQNKTFQYVLKRVLSSLLTLILLAILITALLRCLPDTLFYDVKQFNTIRGKAGIEVAKRWRNIQLFNVGFTDLKGRRVSIIESVANFIYWILPIWKKVPIAWSTDTFQPIDYWEGFIYLGRAQSMNSEYVTDLLASRMGISFAISIITVVLTYLVSVPLGIAMAKKPGGVADKIGNIFIVLNYAIPAIVFYLIMSVLFGGVKAGDTNVFGYYYDEESPILSLIPPIFCIWFLSIPGVSIWIRRFMADELSSDYVKFARSKGLSEKTIMYKHVFRNAVVPLVRNIPATLLGAIVGSYYVETIWMIPGTGILLVNGLQGATPDVQLIQGLTIIYGAISMISFMLGDIITVFFDPRIKLEG